MTQRHTGWVSPVMLLVICAVGHAGGEDYVFDEPSDDVWHYPFNFTPGFRPLGGVFSPGGLFEFNDRDGIVIVGWETDGLIPAGADPASYEIEAISVTLTNFAASFLVPQWEVDLTLDEWFTYAPGGQDTDPGRPIELFGVGFGPQYQESSWNELSLYVGATQTNNLPRDPFPFVFQVGTNDLIHIEDNVRGTQNEDLAEPLCDDPDGICPFTPVPWAIGTPMDYTPGNQTVPFDVEFQIDLGLSDGQVREYFQEQLSSGRILISVSSLVVTQQQNSSEGYPNFFMSDGVPLDPLGKAPTLVVTLAAEANGDFDGDGVAGNSDVPQLVDCLSGPGFEPDPSAPLLPRDCLCVFDFDSDGDVDVADTAEFTLRFANVG